MPLLSKICKGFVVLVVVFSLIGAGGCTKAMVEETAKVPAGWTLQFSDDFERTGLGDNWIDIDNSCSIKDGWLTFSEMGTIMCSKKFVGAHRLEFDARSDSDYPCDLTGIICANEYGYQGGYFVGFGSEYNSYSKLLIEGYEAMQWNALITKGKIHHQVVQRDGKTITHIVDGKTVMTYEHDQPLKGKDHQMIGFYVFSEGQIDNVKVYTKPEE